MVVLPTSLVGRHIGKSFEVALNNLLISQHIHIVGCLFFIISFKIYIEHSVKVWEVSILYFLFYNVFVSFPHLPLGLLLIKARLFAFHQLSGGYFVSSLKILL